MNWIFLFLTPLEYQALFPLYLIDLSQQNDNLQDACLSLSLKLFFKTALKDTYIRICVISEKLLVLQSNGEKFTVVY